MSNDNDSNVIDLEKARADRLLKKLLADGRMQDRRTRG